MMPLPYQAAIHETTENALHAAPLWQFPQEKTVLMIHWTDQQFRPGRQILAKNLWVVSAKQMYNVCRQFDAQHLPLRISQLLGMPPPNNQHWHFVFLTVADQQYHFNQLPAGYLRPCYSTDSIHAQYCHYGMDPQNSAYNRWLTGLEASDVGYPWTGLGYTFDWDPKNMTHIGISEFVIPKGVKIHIIKTETALQYCK